MSNDSKATKATPHTAWKFLRLRDGALTSEHGETCWQIGVWQKIDGKPEVCACGFHASHLALDALTYVQGEVVALVEVAGAHADEGDKSAWQRMRVVRAWHWTPEDSVRLGIHAAEAVLSLYEDKYPADASPRQAIEAARACLTDHSARAAADDARAAARAAAAAARAAAAAARADARAAARADYAVYAAAADARAAAYAQSAAAAARADARAAARAAYAVYAAAADARAAAYAQSAAAHAAAAAAYAAAAAKRQPWDEARREMRERLSAWMEEQIVTQCQPYQPVTTIVATETESE